MKITSMKIYFLTMLLSLFFLGACDKNDEIVPEDADENFITSVVMTVDGKSYTADIADNTVTRIGAWEENNFSYLQFLLFG